MPDVLASLTLTTSNLVTARGQRMEVEHNRAPGSAVAQRVSVRATDAVELITGICRPGARFPEVAAAVRSRWPDAGEATVRSVVLELVHSGYLLTNLMPADVTRDPLSHLLAALPRSCPQRDQLNALRSRLRDADRHHIGDAARMAGLAAARDLADQIACHDRPLIVDVAADARIELPSTLASEAADAATVLWRIGQGQDPLAAYHARFLTRYGPKRFVPLADAADLASRPGTAGPEGAGAGIGVANARRKAALAALIHDSVASGRHEVTLDDGDVADLAHGGPGLPPRTAEICVRVLAANSEDMASGRMHLAVCPAGTTHQAGSTAGRFASLLDGVSAGQVGAQAPDVLAAELVVLPGIAEGASLAPPTGHAVRRIPVGTPSADGDITLDDLMLVSDGQQLILWSAAHDCQVIPALYSRLALRYLPAVARLLALIGQHGSRPLQNWSWEPFELCPFQPRVRYRHTILAPARWVLPPDLTAAARSRYRWQSALDAWRAKVIPRPPGTVATDDSDHQLPLDLNEEHDRELLRRYVRRGVAAVTELPGGTGTIEAVVAGHAGRHVLELVVPLVRRSSPPVTLTGSCQEARRRGEGLYLPGREWLSIVIPAEPRTQNQILASLFRAAADWARLSSHWYWLRYDNAEHGPHLRIRFHGPPATLGGGLLPAVAAWCSELIALRLTSSFSVEPYDQEVERYGGPGAITAAEQLFDADSQLVLAVLAADAKPDEQVLIAALSAAAIAHAIAGGSLTALDGRHLDRAGRARLSALRPLSRSAASTIGSTPASLPGTQSAWAARQAALTAYRDALPPSAQPACASSVIHMHANRMLGDAAAERLARALAADLLARHQR